MKPVFILIIGTLLMCLSFGSALSGETKRQCPNPNLEYETRPGEKYWEWFAFGSVSELVQGDKYICANYSEQGEHGPYSMNFIVSKKDIKDRQKKESGLIRAITIIFRQYDYLLAANDEVVLASVYDEFSLKFVPRAEIITGLKFETADEWFDWWELNKDHLVLSKDGKYLVVKK